MSTAQPPKIDWDNVYYVIRLTLIEVEKDEARHKTLADLRRVNRYEYMASLMTRAVQESIDFTFQKSYDWNAVYSVLKVVTEDSEGGSRERWMDEARRSKRPYRDCVCAKLTRQVAEVIDMNDFLEANGSAFAA